MKVLVKQIGNELSKNELNLCFKFMRFLQKEHPLNKDIKILFLNKRVGKMTTGSRDGNNVIKILTKNRLNRDILRTIAHEWVHEYQMTILKRDRGPDIGGENEDEANAKSGSLIKKFEKKYPHLEGIIYE